ncbi:transcriptional regulator, BadM/Rrf2 family [Cupriavidus sp. OV038]|jgi:Rrf2 family nitric oxide-sensitive transcriptional repressor|uniref:RrF2 family transcriptional regulator n=1 Tax=unclassified Cupriavidus TaxID=2640874 RepID=UPI0008F42493|nr:MULTISPECIES: Rrf2 family transcriptional regulator [unclassified Cupriavidus]SFD26460.1 transcriptional regulator, BadM/Rrf2 family [Cupriavidus sp. OV038]SFP96054.1 transcriptional regulator, BadM/Rrf2 family [Cupriavidus sp. OV096]
MQLTRFSDYALRLLMYVSRADGTRPITIAEVGQQFDISHNHLVKVAARLSKLGWITATRGRHGGLQLGPGAERLSVGTILRELEGHKSVVDCADPPCALKGNCRLKLALDEAEEAFYRALDGVSLGDVIGSRTAESIITLHRNFLNRRAA